MNNQTIIKQNSGLTLIELLVSIVVGSILLIMLMQLVNMNVATRRVYEYENFVTDETLAIADVIRRNLNDLQPQRVDRTDTGTEIIITFTHEYDVIVDPITGVLDKSTANASSETLVYDIAAETLRYEGVILHSSRVKITAGSTITVDYYEDTNPDPATCSDVNETGSDLICGDGIVELILIITVEYDSGARGDVFTFTTRIIV